MFLITNTSIWYQDHFSVINNQLDYYPVSFFRGVDADLTDNPDANIEPL